MIKKKCLVVKCPAVQLPKRKDIHETIIQNICKKIYIYIYILFLHNAILQSNTFLLPILNCLTACGPTWNQNSHTTSIQSVPNGYNHVSIHHQHSTLNVSLESTSQWLYESSAGVSERLPCGAVSSIMASRCPAVGVAGFFWVTAVPDHPVPFSDACNMKAIYRLITPYMHKCCIVSDGWKTVLFSLYEGMGLEKRCSMRDIIQTQSTWHILKEVYKYPAKGFSLKSRAASCEMVSMRLCVVSSAGFPPGWECSSLRQHVGHQ